MAKKSNSNGKNMDVHTDGKKLTITIDLSKTIGDSKSGKNVLIASSGGNMDVGNGVRLGLNAYRSK